MKKRIFLLMSLGLSLIVFSQPSKSQKQIEREKSKVQIFTPEERANLELWFYNQTQKMNLTEDIHEEYDRIFYSRIYDLGRLNDKDTDLSDEEMQKGFDDIVNQMNKELKTILSTDQYIQHLENVGTLMRSVYRKMNWD